MYYEIFLKKFLDIFVTRAKIAFLLISFGEISPNFWHVFSKSLLFYILFSVFAQNRMKKGK